MQILDTTIEYQGRTLRQLKRQGNIALYELRGAGEALYGYELIIIKTAPAETKFGKNYPERELYPSSAKNSKDWGTIAWSYPCNQKKVATARFNGLAKKHRRPEEKRTK